MEKTQIYDLPTRIFHALFSGLFVLAFVIAKRVDDESLVFSYHMLAGLVLVSLVLFRFFWGVAGSRYSRFSSYQLNPRQLIDYLKSVLTGTGRRFAGHNPASSWAAVVMMALTLGLGLTGVLMAKDINKESIEDIHELLANAFVIVAIVHVTGVILHTLKHRDGIAQSMVHGKKTPVSGVTGIAHNHSRVAVLLLMGLGVFSSYLIQGFDSSTRGLSIFGTTLQLGELEDGEGEKDEDEEGED